MDTDWDLVDATMHTGPSASKATRRARGAPPSAATDSAARYQFQNQSQNGGDDGSTSASLSRTGPLLQHDDQARRDERNMAIALHHAKLLQQRKDVEAGNLRAVIELIDVPTSPTADPAHPSREDADAVREKMRNFQPRDLDELIAERNIEHKCGYVLCPRPYADDGGRRGKWTVLNRDHDVRIVKTKDMKHWCSADCARRAMYLRVQLDEKPAWERAYSDLLQLYGEDDEVDGNDGHGNQVAANDKGTGTGIGTGTGTGTGKAGTSKSNSSKLKLGDDQQHAVARMTEDLKRLAIERGNPDVDRMMDDFQKMTVPYR